MYIFIDSRRVWASRMTFCNPDDRHRKRVAFSTVPITRAAATSPTTATAITKRLTNSVHNLTRISIETIRWTRTTITPSKNTRLSCKPIREAISQMPHPSPGNIPFETSALASTLHCVRLICNSNYCHSHRLHLRTIWTILPSTKITQILSLCPDPTNDRNPQSTPTPAWCPCILRRSIFNHPNAILLFNQSTKINRRPLTSIHNRFIPICPDRLPQLLPLRMSTRTSRCCRRHKVCPKRCCRKFRSIRICDRTRLAPLSEWLMAKNWFTMRDTGWLHRIWRWAIHRLCCRPNSNHWFSNLRHHRPMWWWTKKCPCLPDGPSITRSVVASITLITMRKPLIGRIHWSVRDFRLDGNALNHRSMVFITWSKLCSPLV